MMVGSSDAVDCEKPSFSQSDSVGTLIVGICGKGSNTADGGFVRRAVLGEHQRHFAVIVDLGETCGHDAVVFALICSKCQHES